ncbi:MAG TPA: hypothetical protein VF525_03810 [Pyrinomonadaceae bacterium]
MAGSEELEQSLRAEIESYINGRLSSQQAEILRVQSEINQALARLAEQLTTEAAAEPSVAVAVAEHLRRARAQGTEEAGQESARARATSDVALLKAAVDDIDSQRSQSDTLNALVNRAAAFAPRIAFFVIKNERATGWRARGLEGTVGDDAVREISLPLSEQTVLSQVAHARTTWSGTPGTYAADHDLLQKFGGEPPQRMVAIPLVARDRAVAVLYADSAGLEPDAVNLEALETLVRVAGMAVELLAARRAPTPAPQPAAQAAPTPQPAAPAEPAPAPAAAATPAPTAEAAAPALQPEVAEARPAAQVEEAAPATTVEPDVTAEAPALATPAETTTPPTAEESFAVPETVVAAPQVEERGIAPFTMPESASAPTVPATPAPPVSAPPTEPSVTPLGSGRRYGQDAPLPIEVGEDERRFHNDARRFARLLVSEIKLYNEQKVRDGREHGDLYERLREEIDRSRQMYDKRADPRVTGRYDYFHHELVTTLAEGNADKLGREYPGAQVAV